MPALLLEEPVGGNGVPVIFNSISGSVNPFDDPAMTVAPGASIDAILALTGYAHSSSLWDRAAMGAIILPMGRLSGDLTVVGNTVHQSASGFGDPMLEFTINLIGPPAQKTLADALRYQPGLLTRPARRPGAPIGESTTAAGVEPGPEPLVRPHRRAHRLAARLLVPGQLRRWRLARGLAVRQQ